MEKNSNYSFIRRLIAAVICAAMLVGNLPGIPLLANAADTPDSGHIIDKVTDPATVDDWKQYFSATSTDNAGGVWTDKSVFETVQDYLIATGENEDAAAQAALALMDDDHFLVALSAIASTKTIQGFSNIPTDTILVLDVSGSMANANADDDMVNAANRTIHTLLSLNEHNRVGVVLYSSSYQGYAPNDAVLLLPLDRYTAGDTYTANRVTYQEYLKYSGHTVLTGDRLKNSAGSTVRTSSRSVVGATYIQSGLDTAMDEFLAADTVITGDVLQAGTTRMPVTVLMTDGDPTVGSTAYANLGGSQFGDGSNNSNELNFVTQMSAAYMKAKVEEHYGTSSLFYTLGLGDVALSVLDPTRSNNTVNGYWNEFLEDGSVDWGRGNNRRTVSRPANDTITLAQYEEYRYYTTEYFPAQSVNDLNTAFQAIVDAITLQSMYYPTHVDGSDFDNAGYLEFRDYIGEGMEVHAVKGVQHGTVLYTGKEFAYNMKYNMGTVNNPTEIGNQLVWAVMDRLHIEDVSVARELLNNAWNAGQLAYDDSTGEYSNYIGVYLDADGKYLGFWDGEESSFASAPTGALQAVKCYYMFGEVGEGHRATDMLYASIQVRTTISNGEQIVYGRLPASLIPLIQYNVSLNTDSVYTATDAELTVTMTTPSRLIYEVGLDSDTDLNTLEPGTHTFYTNQWEAEVADGSDPSTAHNTFVSFQPSAENERYVYHEDMPVYVRSGNSYVRYTGTAAPSGSSYYRAYVVFTTSGIETHYEAIPTQALTGSTVEKTEEGYWVVKKGTVYRYEPRNPVEKDSNPTGTLDHSEHPLVHMNPSYHLDAVLGNNGKLTIVVLPPKTVTDAEGNDVDGKKVMAGEELTYSITATNYEETASDITITDTIPAGTTYVSGSATENGAYNATTKTITWTFSDVAAGETVKVSFRVTVNDPSGDSIDNAANITIGENDPYVTNTTKTYPEGKVSHVTENAVGENGVMVGSHITYTIYYHNDEATASKVIITDKVPEGTSFVSAEHNGQYDANTGTVTWTIASVPAGTGGAVSFMVHVDADAQSVVENQANIQIGTNDPYVTNSTENALAYGNLILTKTLDGGYADQEFTLVLQSGYQSASALSGSFNAKVSGESDKTVTFVNGEATVTIKGGQSIEIENLPAGITVSVFEQSAPGYAPEYSVGGVTGDDVHVVANGVVQLDVTNHYSTVSAGLILTAGKTLVGRTLIEGMYHFTLKDSNGQTVALGSNAAPAVGTNTGAVTFSEITFTAAGTYTYTLSERNDGLSGVSYDPATYEVVIVVEDNKAGALYVKSVTVGATSVYTGTAAGTVTVESGVEFENTFSTDDLLVPLYGTKILDNRSGDNNLKLQAGEFVFQIVDAATGEVIRTGTNDATGLITFNALEFNFEDMTGATESADHVYTKTFTYLISEDIPDATYDPNMHYDTTEYEVTITVEYNAMNGKWDYVVNYDGTEITDTTEDTLKFTNIQWPTSINVPIQISKTTDHNAPTDAYFSFSVYEDLACTKPISGGTGAAPANTGAYTFTTLNFTDAGEYTYYIRETKAGTTDNGITYDSAVYKVVINVYREDGELKYTTSYFEADGTAVEVPEFHNDYQASGYLTLSASKILSGRGARNGEFSFYIVDEAGNVVATATNVVSPSDIAAEFTFSTIYYTTNNVRFENNTADVIYYMYEEVGSLPGVTYDTNRYKITVRLTNDNSSGVITASVVSIVNTNTNENVDLAHGVIFNNSYEPIHGDSISISINKELTGRDIRDGEFGFRMYHVQWNAATGKYELVSTTPVASAANIGNAATLERYYAPYATPGTYLYKIVETAGNTPGITYDGSYYIVEVEIDDDGKGSLDATVKSVVKYNADDTMAGDVADDNGAYTVSFHNTYKPGAVNFTPEVYKTLTGREMASGEFRFVITDGTNTYYGLSAAAGNGVATQIIFNSLTFTEAGEYIFTISELDEGLGGVEYDQDKITMVINVVDEGHGQLTASAKYYDAEGKELTGQEVGFTNIYEPTPITVTPTATKVLTGKNLQSGEFKFELLLDGKVIGIGTNDADGRVTFQMYDANGELTDINTLTFTGAGTYSYEVREVNEGKAGYTYSDSLYTVTLIVTDNGKGVLSYTYHYYRENVEVGAVSFYNTYTPAPIEVDLDVELDVNKVIDDLANAGFSAEGFKFEVYDWNGELVTSGTSDQNGDVTFEKKLTFTMEGDYRFSIQEVDSGTAGVQYDGTVWIIHVHVTYDADQGILEVTDENMYAHEYSPISAQADDHEGSDEVTFVNTYDPEDVIAEIKLNKKLSVDEAFDRELQVGEFTFQLTDGADFTTRVPNDADGNVIFHVKFDKVGTYTYTVSEVIPEEAVKHSDGTYVLNGVTYSTETVTFTVEVTADGGKLVAAVSHDGESVTITNTYAAKSVDVELGAVKVLNGRDLAANEFSFTLAGEGKSETVKNDKDGNVKFSPITHDAVGTYTYTISEDVGILGGVTYSDVVYTATVVVTDDGMGQLVATVTYTYEDSEGVVHEILTPLFTNEYAAASVKVTLGATKTLSGRDQISDEFEFVLTDAEGNTVTAGNAADGTIVFDPIEFAAAGTYTYTLTETKGTKGGVTYDENVYTVTILVTDNGNGQLVTEVSVGEDLVAADKNGVYDLATFQNSYAAEKVTVDYLEAVKELIGRDLAAGEFEFVLTDKDGKVVASGKNDADGKVVFSKIEYTATGIYTYILSEVKGDLPGVTYSNEKYTVTVVVKDDGLGKLYVDSVSVDHQQIKGESFVLATITNEYKAASVDVTLEAEKDLTGRDLVAGEFTFKLLDDLAEALESVTNAADGSVTFSKITYTAAGTYTYYIHEVKGSEEGMTYDESIIKVTVLVEDNGEGNLVATVTYSEDAVFQNTYEKPVEPTEPETEPTEPETEPTEPETEPTNPDGPPQTGDQMMAHRAVMMMLFCIAAATVLLAGKKKFLA